MDRVISTDSSHKNSRSREQPVLTRPPCRWIRSLHPCSQSLPQSDSNEVTTSTFFIWGNYVLIFNMLFIVAICQKLSTLVQVSCHFCPYTVGSLSPVFIMTLIW
ncbi:unnamed protein product [Cuscuta campestris]|uniref:Uncharacterized protein n=1 Tax=Cuscuta campestris TaxID=132261 RepID=A0A484N0W1_9ASTE|nr:unnamed protein product [Cuscuta campestris]